MNKLFYFLVIFLIPGCAGKTLYTYQQGDTIIRAENTKDYDSFELSIEKDAAGNVKSFKLTETGVSASNPLKAAQDANGKLLDMIMKAAPIP